MSDTIKLITEMPREVYEQIVEAGDLDYLEVITAIENGIPLDSIKAEIDKQEFTHHQGLTHWYMTPSEVKSVVFEILDNIGKESEDANDKT